MHPVIAHHPHIIAHHAPVSCIRQASTRYHIPPKVLAAVIVTEDGRNHQASPNRNGTYDYGIMQINTTWLPTLRKLGYTRNEILNDPCKNIHAGAWILKHSIAKANSFWVGVGNYNSHNPYFNARYRHVVYRHYQEIKYV